MRVTGGRIIPGDPVMLGERLDITDGALRCLRSADGVDLVDSEVLGGGGESGTLPLHTLLPSFLVFLLGDPHLLERSQGGQYRSPDPGAEAPLNGTVTGDELQPHARRGLLRQLTIQPVIEALEQSIPPRDDDAAVQARPDVYITHSNTTGHHVADPQHRISRETLYIGWVKESLWDT